RANPAPTEGTDQTKFEGFQQIGCHCCKGIRVPRDGWRDAAPVGWSAAAGDGGPPRGGRVGENGRVNAVSSEPANAKAIYLHCDVDKMYYSVEALETPALADETRAVIIGIDPREYARGIVPTANGVARSIGITSGMSNAIAQRMAHERASDV